MHRPSAGVDSDKVAPDVWIGTGWKMNKSLAEARAFADMLLSEPGKGDPPIQRFVLPPFTLLREMQGWFKGSDVIVGAQNIHWEEAGA